MLVSTKSKKLVLHLRDPTKVTSVVPTAREFDYKGRTLVAVPHRTPEYRLLKNLGLDPPHPIEYHYDWPIRFGRSPMPHQRATAAFMSAHQRAYCLNDIGTSKTVSNLWAYDFLRSEGTAKKALVVAPLSTLRSTWASEMFADLPHLKWVVAHHANSSRRLALLDKDVDVYVINPDGAKIKRVKEKLKSMDFDVVIIDELTQAAKNANTANWRTLEEITRGRKYVWGLTGAPIPGGPKDAWAQARLITPETVPPYRSHWEAETLLKVGEFRWVPKKGAIDKCFAALQPAVRFKRDQVLASLPPVMHEHRDVGMEPEQQRMFDEMWKEAETELRGVTATAVNEGVKYGKLLQICCGATIADSTVLATPPKRRIKETLDTIQQAAGKTIVFVPYRAPIDLLSKTLAKYVDVGIVHGGISAKKRERIFSEFQTPGGAINVIVAQPVAMSHGLTLTEGNTVVWFAPPSSADTYEQANGRITRPGQKRSQFIVHLSGTAFERKIYERLEKHVKLQGVLLGMFK